MLAIGACVVWYSRMGALEGPVYVFSRVGITRCYCLEGRRFIEEPQASFTEASAIALFILDALKVMSLIVLVERPCRVFA